MSIHSIPGIKDLDIAEKRVFFRLDLNAPVKNGEVTDDTRLRAVVPTINYALARSCRVVIASHLGRPKGEVKAQYSLEPVARRLSEMLDHDIILSDFPVGPVTGKLVREMHRGDIVMLENLRYSPHETKNEESFAQELASYADVYINDAFGTAHRAHASTAGMLPFVQGPCGVGLIMQKELMALGKLRNAPAKPFVTILGGAKVSDKIGLIRSLLEQCNTLLIGGAMAYTFLKAQDRNVGASRVEQHQLQLARQLMQSARARNVEILLPEDHVVATSIDENANTRVVVEDFEDDEMGLDIGPTTRGLFRQRILEAGRVFWNGPMGVFEMAPFAAGSRVIAEAMADTKAYTVVGGGDSAAAMKQLGSSERIDHISTGGGASLALMEGKTLPALKAIQQTLRRR